MAMLRMSTVFCYKQETAYEMRISDWSSDMCATDLCTLMYHWDSPVFGTVIGAGEGIPEEGEFLESYCRMAGRSGLPDLSLYQAFSLFRLACITQAERPTVV